MDAKFVVCTPVTEEEVFKAVEGLSLELMSFGTVPGCRDLIQMIQGIEEDQAPIPAEILDPKSECAQVLWSSGTTGRPKGISHSHQSLWNMMSGNDEKSQPSHHELMTLSFFHIGGCIQNLLNLLQGSTCTYLFGEGLTLEVLLGRIKEFRPAVIIVGTHHYVQLSEFDLKTTDYKLSDFNSVRVIVPSGAAVPAICSTKLRKIFRMSAWYFNGYGQTETYGLSGGFEAMPGLGALKEGCKMKVVNPDTEEICKTGEHGEIRIKSNMMMNGYLNQPRSTYFDSEGFGMTGDVGYYDGTGLVYYVDRMKELIKYCNNHTSPTQLEDILQTHPAVKESLVFGIKEPTVQELISAVVVLNDNHKDVKDRDIIEYVNQRVDADFKKIRGKVLFREKLPRNSMGKLLRREMRRWAENEAKML